MKNRWLTIFAAGILAGALAIPAWAQEPPAPEPQESPKPACAKPEESSQPDGHAKQTDCEQYKARKHDCGQWAEDRGDDCSHSRPRRHPHHCDQDADECDHARARRHHHCDQDSDEGDECRHHGARRHDDCDEGRQRGACEKQEGGQAQECEKRGPGPQECEKKGPGKGCDVARMADCMKEMAEMKAMDAKLEDLISKLDSSAADQKLDALTAIVKELVEQRKAAHAEAMAHCPKQ